MEQKQDDKDDTEIDALLENSKDKRNALKKIIKELDKEQKEKNINLKNKNNEND